MCAYIIFCGDGPTLTCVVGIQSTLIPTYEGVSVFVCVFLVHVCGMVLALNSLRSFGVCVCVCVCAAQSYLSWLSLYLVPSPHCLLSL